MIIKLYCDGQTANLNMTEEELGSELAQANIWEMEPSLNSGLDYNPQPFEADGYGHFERLKEQFQVEILKIVVFDN